MGLFWESVMSLSIFIKIFITFMRMAFIRISQPCDAEYHLGARRARVLVVIMGDVVLN